MAQSTHNTETASPARRAELYDFVGELLRRFGEDQIPLTAAAISFYTILSLIPLLLFAALVAVYFITPEQVNQQLSALQPALGSTITRDLKAQVMLVIQHKRILTAGVVIIGLWTGSQVFLLLESAINMVWRSKPRGFWHSRLLSVLMVVIIGLLMVGAATLINLIRVFASFGIPLLGYEARHVFWLLNVLVTGVVPVLLVSAIFTIVYCILPTRHVTFRTVVPGAVATALLWSVSLHLFGWYAVHYARYWSVYGSLGGVIFLLFWLYYSAFTMLLGAEVSALYHLRLLSAGDAAERQAEAEHMAAR